MSWPEKFRTVKRQVGYVRERVKAYNLPCAYLCLRCKRWWSGKKMPCANTWCTAEEVEIMEIVV